MTTGVLMPLPKQHYSSILGLPLVGGKVYTYAAGGSTLKATYTDPACTVQQPNPIPLNTRGEPDNAIYWSGSYRVVVQDALGNLIYTVDNYNTDPYGIQTILPSLALTSGASLVGYQASGAGTVATTVNSKLSERKSMWDFLTPAQIADTQKASPVLDLSVPMQAARDWLASSQHPTDKANPALVFPAGIYRYSVSPNWAIDNATIINDGAVYFQYTGTGAACIIDADGYGRVNMTFGRFIIQAPSTSLDGALVRQIHHSDIYLTVKGAGSTSAGISVLGCVCTKFHRPTVSDVEYGWYAGARPKHGIYVGSNAMIGQSSACIFDNAICEGLSDTGINIAAGSGNTFQGGTCEDNANYGVQIAYGSNGNHFISMDFEVNTNGDAFIGGFSNTLNMCDSDSIVIFAGAAEGNLILGGYHNKFTCQAGSARNLIDDCFVNRSNAATWLTDSGKNFIGRCVDRYSGTVGIPYVKRTASSATNFLALQNTTLQTMVVYLDNTIHSAVELVAPDSSFTRSQVGQLLVYPNYTANIHFISAGGGNVTYVYV